MTEKQPPAPRLPLGHEFVPCEDPRHAIKHCAAFTAAGPHSCPEPESAHRAALKESAGASTPQPASVESADRKRAEDWLKSIRGVPMGQNDIIRSSLAMEFAAVRQQAEKDSESALPGYRNLVESLKVDLGEDYKAAEREVHESGNRGLHSILVIAIENRVERAEKDERARIAKAVEAESITNRSRHCRDLLKALALDIKSGRL